MSSNVLKIFSKPYLFTAATMYYTLIRRRAFYFLYVKNCRSVSYCDIIYRNLSSLNVPHFFGLWILSKKCGNLQIEIQIKTKNNCGKFNFRKGHFWWRFFTLQGNYFAHTVLRRKLCYHNKGEIWTICKIGTDSKWTYCSSLHGALSWFLNFPFSYSSSNYLWSLNYLLHHKNVITK